MCSEVLEDHRKQCEAEGKYVGKLLFYISFACLQISIQDTWKAVKQNMILIATCRGWDGQEQDYWVEGTRPL